MEDVSETSENSSYMSQYTPLTGMTPSILAPSTYTGDVESRYIERDVEVIMRELELGSQDDGRFGSSPPGSLSAVAQDPTYSPFPLPYSPPRKIAGHPLSAPESRCLPSYMMVRT